MRLVSLIVACALWNPGASWSGDLESVRLQLQWKHQFEFAGFYAASEKGFYAEAGLDVELIEFREELSTIDEVVEGRAEYGIGYSSIVAEYLEGQPVVLLANFFKRSPIAIVAQPHIRSPEDLAGKSVMGLADNIDDITLRLVLDKFDVDVDSIASLPPSYSVQAFIDNDVDAMVVFSTNEVFDLDRAGKKYTLFDPTVYGAEYYDVNLFTSRAELERHPGRARRFRDASIRGWEYALQHPDEIIALIQRRFNTQQKTTEALRFEAEQIGQVVMAAVAPVGSIDLQRLESIAADFVQLGILPEDTVVDLEQLIMREPLESLNLSAVERKYLGNRGPIRFCAGNDRLPFENVEDGRHGGMAADYLALLSEKLTTEFELVPTTSWAESLELVRRHRCDLLSLAMATPERRAFLNFTDPYLRFPLVIAARNETLFIPDIDRVGSEPVGIVAERVFGQVFRDNHPEMNLIEVQSLHEGLQKVADGELFGFIDSLATINHALQRRYIGELKIAGSFDEFWELGFGVRNDDPVLFTILQKAVNAVTADEHREINNRWISVTYERGSDYRLLSLVLTVVAIAIAVFMYHSHIQSRFVSRLKEANQEIQQKNRELQKLSTTDALTGLHNRFKLDELLRREATLFDRYRRPFSLILVDFDLFKRVNDSVGHLTGDRVLVAIASSLAGGIRQSDEIGRWGGEEFLIICPATRAEQAMTLAEKLRALIPTLDLGLEQPQTLSMGVAEMRPGHSIHNLLSDADRALYRAKATGRNRVECA